MRLFLTLYIFLVAIVLASCSALGRARSNYPATERVAVNFDNPEVQRALLAGAATSCSCCGWTVSCNSKSTGAQMLKESAKSLRIAKTSCSCCGVTVSC